MGLEPAAHQSADLVNGSGGVLVTAEVKVAQVFGEPNAESKFLKFQVGSAQVSGALTAEGGRNQAVEHPQCLGL